MPWKEFSRMDERLKFVARRLDGETMTRRRGDGTSQKTGYTIINRAKGHGLEALSDCARRPCRQTSQLPDLATLIRHGTTGQQSVLSAVQLYHFGYSQTKFPAQGNARLVTLGAGYSDMRISIAPA